MTRSEISKLSFIGGMILSVFIINGCKKEAVVKQIAPVTINADKEVDSANYLKGYFDGEPIKFEGNAYAYSAFVDPDSTQTSGQGNSHDHDAYYQSGSNWMKITNGGVLTSNATVELRSLSVRVFVSPTLPVSTNFYNLLSPSSYPITDGDDDISQGAYITLHDKNGVMWTSHGNQTGSNMVILTRGANMSTYTVVTGTINCKLYDGEGNMKKLTAASFTAAIGI